MRNLVCRLRGLALFAFACMSLLWIQEAAFADTSTDTGAPSAAPQKVLFVGNSFTYYNSSLHNHVGNFLRAGGTRKPGATRLRALTLSGARLHEHAGAIAGLVKPDEWDRVVMHGHSTAMMSEENTGLFNSAAKKFARIIRDNGAEPVLLMTWPYKGRPEMTSNLRKGYGRAGELIDAQVLPVGLAFDRVNRAHPDIELYSPDISAFTGTGDEVRISYQAAVKHPSEAGTYLAAAVVVAALFGESPLDSRYRAGLDAETAAILQQVAAETVERYFFDSGWFDSK